MERPTFEFHIAREARDRYAFADRLFSVTGNVVIADLGASRELAHRMNSVRDAARHPSGLSTDLPSLQPAVQQRPEMRLVGWLVLQPLHSDHHPDWWIRRV